MELNERCSVKNMDFVRNYSKLYLKELPILLKSKSELGALARGSRQNSSP